MIKIGSFPSQPSCPRETARSHATTSQTRLHVRSQLPLCMKYKRMCTVSLAVGGYFSSYMPITVDAHDGLDNAMEEFSLTHAYGNSLKETFERRRVRTLHGTLFPS
ncbi:hypothetical protein VNO77_34419 [Canavalia gladiata]|uniref:Uncharacterized protein n=1 Tax=Canavalia gladiata TaxID=3824 RepID=A0AAN9KGI0_CANGL